jgi:lysophospholipase L1-like esterase
MSLCLRPDDPRLSWPGAITLEAAAEWASPWRISHTDRALYHEALVERAAMPAGVRLSFVSNSTAIRGRIVPQAEMSSIDLCCDGEFFASQELAGRDSFQFEGLLPGEKRIELWLPQFGAFRLRALELEDGATLSRDSDERPRWITYGSSISQCRTAASPTQTWPAIVARRAGLDLTCLGFGGQCHLDPLIALLIRDRPADLISLCMGINIYGGATLGPRTFRSNLIAFVQIVRERHPRTPLALISPIYSPPRESTPNAVGFTLQTMREEVAAAVDILRSHSDPHVTYINGLELFGPELAHLLPDELHPNAEGYRLLGHNFLQKALPRFYPLAQK